VTPELLPDEWLRVPYDGPELAVIELEATGTGWQPAYLDWDDTGRRVAQIPWHNDLMPAAVNLRVDGTITGTWP
jgi:hypothetical protein